MYAFAVVSISSEGAAEYARALHAAYSPALSAVVDVQLPDATAARFEEFFNRFDLADRYPLPGWVEDFYSVQDALTASHYRQRRLAEIEEAVIGVLQDAVMSVDRLPVMASSAIRTQALTYEYQAFLFDFRRTFEYLSLGIAGAFSVTPPRNSRDLAKTLLAVDTRYAEAASLIRPKIIEIGADFARTLAEDSPRNTLAHHAPVHAGDMRIFLDPGLEPRIGLDGGGESLPIRYVPSVPGTRLATVLQDQLAALTDAVFALLSALPTPPAGLEP